MIGMFSARASLLRVAKWLEPMRTDAMTYELEIDLVGRMLDFPQDRAAAPMVTRGLTQSQA